MATTVAFSDLNTWLQAQPVNTASTPYELNITGLTVSDIRNSSTSGTLGNVLRANKTKYVDLSSTSIPNGVTSLYRCFYSCTSLTEAPVIPNGVTNMDACFHSCTSLTEAPVIPNGVTNMSYCFQGCTSLTETPVIPSSVTNLSFCFSNCTSLITANLKNPTNISTATTGNFASMFMGCTALTTIKTDVPYATTNWLTAAKAADNNFLPNAVSAYNVVMNTPAEIPFSLLNTELQNLPANTAQTAYQIKVTELVATDVGSANDTGTLGYVLMENGRKYVDLSETALPNVNSLYETFCGCASLTKAPEIPSGVTTLERTFYGCISLVQTPVIPSSVTNMHQTFSACILLTQAPVIPNGVTTLYETFIECTALTQSPAIPSSVTTMERAFRQCSALTQVLPISNGVTNMQEAFVECTRLTQVPAIPNSVTNMSNTFAICTSLTQAPVLSNNVTNMYATFSDCTSLIQAPVIPSGVTNLRSTFLGCTSLTQVQNVPSSVTDLRYAFKDCSALEEISLFEVSSSVLENNAQNCFQGCTSLTKIGVSNNISEDDWHVYKLKIGSNTLEGKVFDRQGTATAIAQTSVSKSDLKLPFKTDELWFPNGQTDAEIESIIQKAINYKYSWFKKDCLPPDQENFVLWAKDPTNFHTNLSGFGTLYADMPVGTVIPYMGKLETIPTGFLYCDATVRHKADWLELWNVLPDVLKDTVNETFTLDLRECTLVGVGQSANDYDANTNPTGIHDHDVYTLGEFKDDQVQNIRVRAGYESSWSPNTFMLDSYKATSNYTLSTLSVSGRFGTTTHGKQTGVAYIIKAKQIGVPHDIIANVDALVNQLITQKLNDQDELSDFEIIGNGTVVTNYNVQYDGYIYIHRDTGSGWGGSLTRNGTSFNIKSLVSGGGNLTLTVPVRKGDIVNIGGSSGDGIIYGAFYKFRDYSTPTLIYRDTISTNSVAISSREQLVENGQYTVMFTRDISAPDGVTPLTVTFNHSAPITVKASKDGSLVNVYGKEVATSTYKYLQAYTTLELMYDGTNFVILGNPVVLSSSDYVIYADGFYEYKKYTDKELWTGRYYSDGKPIYKYSYEGFNVSEGTLYTINNLDKVVKIQGTGQRNSNSDISPFDSTNMQLYVRSNNLRVYITATFNRITASVEYTKSTDTAGTVPPFVAP